MDELLQGEDLPADWYLPDYAYRDDMTIDPTDPIDIAVRYYDSDKVDELAQVSWKLIEHTPTHTRVFIRLQYDEYAVPPEVRITGVIYLPWRPSDPITSQLLRELPTAKIEAAINKRLFNMKQTNTLTGSKIVLPSGKSITRNKVLTPLPDPKSEPDFYELVALQHQELSRNGSKNPTAEMAEINAVALSTAQGWVAKARSRNLLPPGRRGRAG